MHHSPCFKFFRTLGLNPGDSSDDVTFIVGQAPSPFSSIHDSVFSFIIQCLTWRELLTARQVSARVRRAISLVDIVHRMVAEVGLCMALCHCIGASPKICQILITHYEVPRAWLIYTLLFCMIYHYNDVAIVLLNHLSFPIHCPNEHILGNYNYNFGDIFWFRDFLAKTPASEDPLMSQTLLLPVACAANNVDLFQHVTDLFHLEFTSRDVWFALMRGNHDILLEMQKQKPNMRISQRMLLKYLYLQTTYFATPGKHLEMIEFLLAQGLTVLSRRLQHKIITYFYRQVFISPRDIKASARIIDGYGSHRLLKYTLNTYIHLSLNDAMNELNTISNRVTFNQRHLDMMATNIKVWSTPWDIEGMVINNIRMREVIY